MDTQSSIVHVKIDDMYKDIAEVAEARFYISIYELHNPLPKGINKKVIGPLKDQLGAKGMNNLLD